MKLRPHYFVGAAAAAVAMLAAAAVARSETGTLELKRLESQSGSLVRSDYIYRSTYPQHFFVQMRRQGKDFAPVGNQEEAAAFKRIVNKEPQYQSKCPLRGVAKLGSQEYAFAIDALRPEPRANHAKPKADEKPAQGRSPEDGKKTESGSAAAKPEGTTAEARPPSETPSPQAAQYNRLYFDFNHNGDLTDDKLVEAENQQALFFVPASYVRIQFPRVDVTIDVEGTKVDYAFLLSGYVNVSEDFSYAAISLNAAAYREGDITLEGKKRHVVLIDFNSNGRFDDQMTIRSDVYASDRRLYPEQGDMLLVDPSTSSPFDSPYDVTTGDSRHHVSKLVDIDGRFYDLEISPAGDELRLSPSPLPLGAVTNPNDGFRAVIYGDRGFLRISGSKGTPVAVPEGEWKLLSYTINWTGRADLSQPTEKESGEEKAEKEGERNKSSLLQTLTKSLDAIVSGATAARVRQFEPRVSLVSAQATDKYEAVKVVKGETVELPFGPPYKPTVTASPAVGQQGARQTALEMSLVGTAGEICTNMMVDGGRPSKPQFTISDPEGKIVEQGSFEYG